MGKKNRPKHYLSNKEMYAEVLACQDTGVVSDKLGRMFLLLSTRMATKSNFSGYSYKDEFIANGVMACCAAVMKFDGTKSQNPFGYYSMILKNAFVQVLNKERRHQEIRDELLMEHDMDPSFGYIERHKDDHKLDSDEEE